MSAAKSSNRLLILNQPSIKEEKAHTAIYLKSYKIIKIKIIIFNNKKNNG